MVTFGNIQIKKQSKKMYDKLIQLLIRSLIQPDEVMIMGGTYETPILEGLLDEDFVQQLKLSGTFNQDSFDRQYKRFCTIKIIENCWNTLRAI